MASEFVTGTGPDGSPVQHPAYSTGRGILETLHSGSAKLSEATAAIRAAGLSNDPQTEARLRRSATATMNAMMKRADEGLATLGQHRESVDSEIVATLGIPNARNEVTTAMRAGDVRAYLRSLPTPTERSNAIRQAAQSGDIEVVAAVLSAPAMASGLGDRDHQFVRADAERIFTPGLSSLRASIDKLRTHVERAVTVTEKAFGGLTGTGTSNVARAESALRALSEGGES